MQSVITTAAETTRFAAGRRSNLAWIGSWKLKVLVVLVVCCV